jgi:hypothetical protein
MAIARFLLAVAQRADSLIEDALSRVVEMRRRTI